MKYYRVKKECHDKKVKGIYLVKNELFTEREKNLYQVPDNCICEVVVKKTDLLLFYHGSVCEFVWCG